MTWKEMERISPEEIVTQELHPCSEGVSLV
jgi:hypothetical protein